MDKRKNRNQIQNALNATLSGLQDDPWLAQRVIAEAKGAKKVKKKLSAGLVIAIVLIIIVTTALAVATLCEVAQMIAQTEQDSGNFGFWPAEKKVAVVTALADQGYIEETDTIKQMREDGFSVDEANQAADTLIEAFTGWKASDTGFMVIMQAAWGPFDTWSDEDKAWYSRVMEDVGVESDGKTVYVLPEGRISKEQAVEIATKAIVEGTGIDESVLENYNLIVNFQVPEFAEEGDQQPYWYVMYDAKENSPDNPFPAMELFIHPQTGELLESVEEILERWANLPRRPDNALYQAIDSYYKRAMELGVYSFREWPLELRAEYSQEINPMVQAILDSGDTTELMNCGNLDIQVIAQSSYVYGMPDEQAISQEDAYALATEALMEAYTLPADHFEKYAQVQVYYDITNAPCWRFFFNPKELDVERLEGGWYDPLFNVCFKVEIDAYTGEMLHTERFDFKLSGHDLAYELKWY